MARGTELAVPRYMRSLSCLLILSALLVQARPADACSRSVCWGGAFVPGDASTIPSNAPGLYWRPGSGESGAPSPASVRLTTVGAPGSALPFTATSLPGGDYVLVPAAPLVEGTSYVLEDLSICNGTARPRVTFTAGPSAPLPTSLGTVSTDPHGYRAEIDVATSVGSCSTTIDATLFGIALEPSAEAAPWMALLMFETVVDDQRWVAQESINVATSPGASWKGRGRDLLYRICTPNPDASYQGMSLGGHQVAFRASLPTAQPISAAPLGIELMCDLAPDTDPDDDSAVGCASSKPSSSSLILVAFAALLRRRRR